MTSEFVHLHNHSDYSLLDGAQKVDQLVNTIDCLSEEYKTKFIGTLLDSEDGFVSMVEFANGVE